MPPRQPGGWGRAQPPPGRILGPESGSLQSPDLTDFKTGRAGSAYLSYAPGSTSQKLPRAGGTLPLAHCLVTLWTVNWNKQAAERFGARALRSHCLGSRPSSAAAWTGVLGQVGLTLSEPWRPL